MPFPPAFRAPPGVPSAALGVARRRVRPVACLALLALVSACGNRGDLYLASELDADLERDLEPLVPGEPVDPSPLVPDGGIAPSVSPDPDATDGDPEDGSPDETARERRRDGGGARAR